MSLHIFLSLTFLVYSLIIDTSCDILGCIGESIAEIEAVLIFLTTARHEYELILKEVIALEMLAMGTEIIPSVWILNWWMHRNWDSLPQYLRQSFSNWNTLPTITSLSLNFFLNNDTCYQDVVCSYLAEAYGKLVKLCSAYTSVMERKRQAFF